MTDKVSPLARLGGDDFTVIFPPFSLDFDEIMGVYPRFEGMLVVGWKGREGSDEEFFGKDDNVFVITFSLIIVCSPR